jgi:predicted hydrocarbon binding protein
MVISDMELAETIRFAMKATRELDLKDFHLQKNAVSNLGAELGHEVAKRLATRKKKGFYVELASFWNGSGLGNITVVQTNPIVIKLEGCYDCSISRMSESPLPCTFKMRLLETIFEDFLGATISAQEQECCKSGGTGCVFRLKVGASRHYFSRVQARKPSPDDGRPRPSSESLVG